MTDWFRWTEQAGTRATADGWVAEAYQEVDCTYWYGSVKRIVEQGEPVDLTQAFVQAENREAARRFCDLALPFLRASFLIRGPLTLRGKGVMLG